jgi:hypothetical protein
MVALARAFLDNPHWGWHAATRLAPGTAALASSVVSRAKPRPAGREKGTPRGRGW